MQRLLQDLRFAMRRLRRTPGFTLIAVLSLALGIGANTAIFSLVQAVLLRDPPVREPERVVEVYLHSSDYAYVPFSIPDFREFQRASAQVFSTSFGSVLTLVARDRGDQVETLPAEMVTGDYFETLGLAPAYGRLLTRTDDVSPGAHAVVVLSWDYWQRAFQGDLAAVGQALRLNGRAYTIVGIAPREYEGNLRTLAPALYVPIMMVNQLQPSGFDQLAERGDHSMFVRARLRPGATLARAEAMLQSFAGDMKTRFRDHWPQNVEIRSVVLADLILNPMLDRYVMLAAGLLSVVVGLVLLIACANLASFLLAQARDRRREIAIKLALGSGRGQLVRQLLTESIALSLIGGACALVLAKGLLGLLLNTDLPLPLPITVKATLDPAVLLFALAVSLVAGVLFGLAPALQTTRADVVSTIKNENTGGGPRRRLNLRNTLVVGQVAVSLVLLVTAGLFLRSLANRRMIDPGFGAEPTAVIQIGISAERYTPAEARLLVKRMEAQVGAIPGVQAAGVTGNIHLNTLSTQTMGVTVEGFEPPPGRREFDIDRARVDPGFFSAAGIPIQRGRNFDDALDLDGAPRVAIVNQVLADKFWPGQDAVGRTFRSDTTEFRIIGVARNAKIRSLGEDPRAFIYVPLSQSHTYLVTLLARTTLDAERTVVQALTTVRAIDPDLVILNAKTMERHLGIVLLPARLAVVVFGALASLALILALVGVYGVVSYSVARRSREVGIRLSLGARPIDVLRLLMRDGFALVAIGGSIGLVMALLATRVLRSVLFEVQPLDPITFAAGPVLLTAVGALAAWLPARRATRIDPARVLKTE